MVQRDAVGGGRVLPREERGGREAYARFMAATVEDVIKANIVLVGYRLLATPDSANSFRDVVGTDVQMGGLGLETEVPSGRTVPVIAISVPKDRISLELSNSRSTIEMEYPSLESLTRLSEVAYQAVQCSPQNDQLPRAVGYNLELVFDQDSGLPAAAYLAHRLFGSTPFRNELKLVGGSGQMVFSEEDHRWQIALAPRFNDESTSRIYANLNIHFEGPGMPSDEDISRYLRLCWDRAHYFVTQFDVRS